MIVVSLLFLYILSGTCVSGYVILDRILYARMRERVKPDISACAVTGTVAAGVYAQIWSIFGSVGAACALVWLLLCLACAVWKGRALADALKRGWNARRAAVFALLFFLFAYTSSHGYAHYDTGLYHAQAIRWIEEAGVVRGLGNLHNRLAYNSAAFPLTALFGFSFLGGPSFHVAGGFMAMLLAWQCADIGRAFRSLRFLPSDGARLAAILYLCNVFDEIISPASDYFTMIAVFSLVIFWLRLTERAEEDALPYILPVLYAAFAATLKLSASCMLLLAVQPVALLLRRRQRPFLRTFLFSAAGVLLVMLPFLVRNVLLSGYLLYPFPGLDLFSVPWKMPLHVVLHDAQEIGMYGRGAEAAMSAFPLGDWVFSWWGGLALTDRLVLAADAAALLFWVVCLVRGLRAKHKGDAPPEAYAYLSLMAALYASLLLWFFAAPLMRYGYAFVRLPAWISCVTMLRLLAKRLSAGQRRAKGFLCAALAGLLLCYKGYRLAAHELQVFSPASLITQEDYEHFETLPFELDGVTIYLPAEGDRTGYEPFPAAPYPPRIRWMGESIFDGMMPDAQEEGTLP